MSSTNKWIHSHTTSTVLLQLVLEFFYPGVFGILRMMTFLDFILSAEYGWIGVGHGMVWHECRVDAKLLVRIFIPQFQ